MTEVKPITAPREVVPANQAENKKVDSSYSNRSEDAVHANVRPGLGDADRASGLAESLRQRAENGDGERFLDAAGTLDEDVVRRLLEE